MLIRSVVPCLLVVMSTLVISADDKVAFLDKQQAGPDFAAQGEYVGQLTDDEEMVGIQVMAQGNGEFLATVYSGGLPGDGWDTNSKSFPVAGRRTGAAVVFESDHGKGRLVDGVLEVFDKSGQTLGSLKRVERKSPTLGQKPPAGAVVLFDGKSATEWKNGRLTSDGLLQQGMTSKKTFGDFTLHLEFQLSFMPFGRGQGRSNSGIYMQGRHELQILDSFGLKGEHNECGGIYSVAKPRINMCFPPLAWQAFDVKFTAARFQDGQKVSSARMTVRHNGVLVHEDVEVDHATTAAPLKEGPNPGPIYVQNHGNPVRFRNIWIVPGNAPQDAFESTSHGRIPSGLAQQSGSHRKAIVRSLPTH